MEKKEVAEATQQSASPVVTTSESGVATEPEVDYSIPVYGLRLVTDRSINIRARETIKSMELVVKLAKDLTRDSINEKMIIAYLDNANKVIGLHIQEGAQAHCEVMAKEILQKALLINAAKMLMVHNHPARSLRPSNGDIRATKHFSKLAKMLGIDLMDHIIVSQGRRHYFSFREQARAMAMMEALDIPLSIPAAATQHLPNGMTPEDVLRGILGEGSEKTCPEPQTEQK
jgi:DNA repair protein RadC